MTEIMRINNNSDLKLIHKISVKSLDYIGVTAFALRNEMPIFVPYLKGNH